MLGLAVAFSAELLAGGAKAECQPTKCGGVDIPYPGPQRSSLGQIRVMNPISSSFLLQHHLRTHALHPMEAQPDCHTPFMLSDSNKLTVIGCRTLAYIADEDYVGNYMSGCVSTCRRGEFKSATTKGICNGIGCCQTKPIPRGLDYYRTWFDVNTMNTSSEIYNRTPCSYAVRAYGRLQLHLLNHIPNSADRLQHFLRWPGADGRSCDEAQKDPKSYMCKSENSRLGSN
ncbi:hypothetical protein GUJ93_ZPchr0004g38650 [Zizania palustris]|uniref:Wall-associated receptor kinase galacturonan-binding domain-containing protein n=1 Tax=Zizania palustris TaxID=103762 RepID=A0A8J5V7Y9_ZIZPA|nr:hypothetical protein GUJ93_ZPchr0004g38650 [Zizania palustris]